MVKKSKFGANPGTGISSILMIFVVLCITTFGVLSFVSARADLKLTEANAQTVKTYYSTEAEIQRTLAKLDALLKKVRDLPENASVEESVQQLGLSGGAAQDAALKLQQAQSAQERYAVLAAYAAASLQENADVGDGEQAVYAFTLNETHELRVTVRMNAPGQEPRCSIASEQICETGSESDQPLNVWPGN